jgi:sulfate adenylyltransferase subunit 2
MFIKKKTKIEERIVRFRTVGDMSCTAAVDSYAATISEVVGEIRLSTISKEGPELTINVLKQQWKRKQQGYF